MMRALQDLDHASRMMQTKLMPDALVRVDDRRWDLRMKDGSLIQLPAQGEEQALLLLEQLNERSRILALGFERIDLRNPDAMTVRPRANAPVGQALAGGALVGVGEEKQDGGASQGDQPEDRVEPEADGDEDGREGRVEQRRHRDQPAAVEQEVVGLEIAVEDADGRMFGDRVQQQIACPVADVDPRRVC